MTTDNDKITNKTQAHSNVLVTGATGYVGGRLVPELLECGYNVRVLVRDAARLQGRAWLDRVDVVEGDVMKAGTLADALDGMDAAYYLIHSMGNNHNFAETDLQAARGFSEAARDAGVKRIIYLGGLGSADSELSTHLRSRQETGDALREAGVPVTEFRAAVIVGSGSLSFEMIRYLTERVPLMICPSWVYTRIQPIAIRNVLDYLVRVLDVPESAGEILEIGGTDVLTYGTMMTGYARVRKLRRLLLPVPVLTPRLSSHWVHWVTPIPAAIARPLIDGLRNEVVVTNTRAQELFPDIRLLDYETAVSRALNYLNAGQVETAWSDALTTSNGDRKPVTLTEREGMLLERRMLTVDAPASSVFQVLCRLGGEQGWLAYNWAWRVRGFIDRLVGGVGFRRGRRDPETLRVGDALDFWRVEAVVPDRQLRLRAEMKVPGEAWLQFDAVPEGGGASTRLVQTAFFAPRGLSGLLYWYALYPIHGLIFSALISRLAEKAVSE